MACHSTILVQKGNISWYNLNMVKISTSNDDSWKAPLRSVLAVRHLTTSSGLMNNLDRAMLFGTPCCVRPKRMALQWQHLRKHRKLASAGGSTTTLKAAHLDAEAREKPCPSLSCSTSCQSLCCRAGWCGWCGWRGFQCRRKWHLELMPGAIGPVGLWARPQLCEHVLEHRNDHGPYSLMNMLINWLMTSTTTCKAAIEIIGPKMLDCNNYGHFTTGYTLW